MQNCIFSGHCTNPMCDKSCPTLAETTYLLDRNGITMKSDVFHANIETILKYDKMLDDASGSLRTVLSKNTVQTADLITYAAICKNWKGSQLHCTVYNLKYSNYIEAIQNSWSVKNDSVDLEMMKIWANNAKVLIISNLDYVHFKDFQCQTLLTLLQSRSNSDLTTIVVSPVLSALVGSSPFFGKLQEILSKAVKK